MSEEEIAYFNSLSDRERRQLLKEGGFISAVNCTAVARVRFARGPIGRQAAQEPRPRELDELNQEIADILEEKPYALWTRVVEELQLRAGPGGVIHSVTKDVIEWGTKGPVRKTNIYAIKDRVYRTRKKSERVAG